MKDTILSLLVIAGILIISAVITNVFARAMYNRCRKCGTLNAKRRDNCRACNTPLIAP
jgi:hypothetical protein